MSDSQVVAILVCLFRRAERVGHMPNPRPLHVLIEDARQIVASCRVEAIQGDIPDSYVCAKCELEVSNVHHDKFPLCLKCWLATRET